MPRPKLTIPADLDMCDCVLFHVPIKLIPIVGGLFEYLEWAASWVEEDRLEGEQIALELQRRLIMSECESSIAAAIDRLAVCVCASTQGELTGGIPVVPLPETFPDYDDAVSTVTEDEGDPPTGFATWDDWRDYRCQAAQWIVDRSILLTERIQTLVLQGGYVGASGLAAALLLLGVTAPAAAVAGVASALILSGGTLFFEAQAAWLTDHRQALICAVSQSENAAAASAAIDAVFSDWSTLLLGSPLLARLPFWFVQLNQVYDGGIPSANLASYDADYCDICYTYQGSDWWAVNVNLPIELDHSAGGSSWVNGYATWVASHSDRAIGAVFTVEKAGNCQNARMSDPCTGAGKTPLFTNTSDNLVDGTTYLAHRTGEIANWSEVFAAIAPGATELTVGVNGINCPAEICMSFTLGYTCTGTATDTVTWIIFARV